MSPRTGRPIQGATKKTLSLQIRMNRAEMAVLDECAKRMQTTRTVVVNRGILMVKRELDKKEESND